MKSDEVIFSKIRDKNVTIDNALVFRNENFTIDLFHCLKTCCISM